VLQHTPTDSADVFLVTQEDNGNFGDQTALGRGIDFTNVADAIETLDGPTAR
jgi:hypothetical protein